MDHFYEYGVTKLFTTLALRAADKFGVERDRVHLDSSSMAVEGQYVKDQATPSSAKGDTEKPCPIEITHGYSRDRRPDLKQFLIETICSGDGDVPLYLRVADGNETDGVGFRQVVDEYRHQWQLDGLLVADAALYSAETLKQLQELKWISRVPLTLSEAQAVIRQVVPVAGWDGLAKGYRLIERCTTQAEVTQRWVIVESAQRREADLKALQKRIKQAEERQQRQLDQLLKESFACEADALKAMKQFEQTLRYSRLSQVSGVQQAHHGKRGRPKQNSQPQTHSYHLQATFAANQETIEEQQPIAGRFILATNGLECDLLPAVAVLAEGFVA